MPHEVTQIKLLQQLDQEAEQARKNGQMVSASKACDMIDKLIVEADASSTTT